ncbi:Nucleoporin p58/p45 [Entomortierella chlamydospora]|uniref:Nucleoporin p58/p45 n=1 Tax=Entomortierella chlamydospora TaxID=101097 RepID=A0A9P6MUP9_9FUNG|nr:Nucleoporin p58/p45 [Entomortierella chlamydospora]KAG0014261.1 Nucleoporin p58/p45 [Entomortierella chlamydospora]
MRKHNNAKTDFHSTGIYANYRHSVLSINRFGAPATPTTSTPAATKPFGGIGLTISTPANPFASLSSTPASSATTTSAPPAAAATAATTASLYPTLSAPASAAASASPATSATSAPSLFAGAPATLTTGSLFSNPNSTAASNALSTATGKNILSSSSSTAPAVALTPDTIAGSTKYTELPADAKSTLDQFHSFLQGQIHLSATLTARPSESLDKISRDTEELSKRLTTLNDALERDTKVIQALQDKVGQELKQADSAGRIIEAYANPSHANFLYAGNNSAGQYFMDQCQSFEEQLRLFRGTIEEIERHLASFGAKYPHVSHALPEVLRNQHEGFLAVASRVAALHDEIKDKEKAYLMFRRKFFDDDSDPFQANIKHRKTDSSQHGQSLRNSTRSIEGQKSFREIAKETLRPGNVKGSSAAAASALSKPATMTSTGSSLFGAAPASGTSLFGAAPASGTSLFGAAPASGTSLFGAAPASTSATPTFTLTAPAATTPGTSLFGGSTLNTSTPFSAFKK